MMDNKSYYNEFSKRYDDPRDRGYHWMLDTLESNILKPLVVGREVLEVGCGTGLVMDRLQYRCRRLQGLDISPGMAAKARERGHEVTVGGADALPFADESFDVVYSFKVLAHVEPIRAALREVARVLRPGGLFVGDFYNPMSLRGLIKKVKPATRIAESTDDHQVYTRFDTAAEVEGHLPQELSLTRFQGVRVLTPWAGVFKVPGVSQVLPRLEEWAGKAPGLWRLGGFLVAIAEKRG